MEQQLNLGHLLTAARLLDIGALDISSLDLGALTSTSSSPGSTSPAMFDLSNESELRSLFSGKLKIDKKHSSSSCASNASTSSQLYCSSPPARKSSKHSRAAHNELEKNRRANLRGCLEALKMLVPCVCDATRNTTLALLTRARDHIIELQDGNAEQLNKLTDLKDEHEALLAELSQLQADDEVAQATSQGCQTLASPPSRPESRASSFTSTSSRDSPCYLEYSPSSKPMEYHKPAIIDLYAEGLIPRVPITFPRPVVYPQNVFDLLNLPSTPFDVSQYLPINLQV
uniref:BHLH domain-containing protein n=1 Tax=Caenorhabditis tropicalis TaxID=1561998 RepID=A0A1I7SXD8_9PELO